SAPEEAWRWLTVHLPDLDRMLTGTPLLSTLLAAALPMLGPSREDEARAYFARNPYPEADRGVRKGLERMEINSAFLRRLAA
ncbi:MAG: hypothetical protein ACREC5_05825, partial [Thermoplasmata archaeon]